MSIRKWTPSHYEQRLLWWLQQATRFGIGGGGLVYEVLVDKLHNPLALLVFGILATATDMAVVARRAARNISEERAEVERMVIREELEREHERERQERNE